MDFQKIAMIESSSQDYVRLFFEKGLKKQNLFNQSSRYRHKIIKLRKGSIEFLKYSHRALERTFNRIIISFPSFDNSNEFYTELFETHFDVDYLRKSLGSLAWAIRTIKDLEKYYFGVINNARSEEEITRAIKSYRGRFASIINQISKNIAYLRKVRSKLQEFPNIKEGLFTIAIAGFPNVGKSTLLSQITTAKPEIKSYAFTTKGLNIGYIETPIRTLQLIDTPGTLNRDKLNDIEQNAVLVQKYIANLIVFVFDPTPTYSYDDQISLLKNSEVYDKKILVYISKTDLISKDKLDSIKAKIIKDVDHELLFDRNILVDEIFKITKYEGY